MVIAFGSFISFAIVHVILFRLSDYNSNASLSASYASLKEVSLIKS